MERNRQAAQERRRLQTQEPAALSDDQLSRIECNRLAALERQRAAHASCLLGHVASAAAEEAEQADEVEEKGEDVEEEEVEQEEDEQEDGEQDEVDSVCLEGLDLDALIGELPSTSDSESEAESASTSRSSGESDSDIDVSDRESDSSASSVAATVFSEVPVALAAPAAPATSAALSNDQRERIERNRLAAREKRRLLVTSMTPEAQKPCAGASASGTSPDDGSITPGNQDIVHRIFGESTPAKVPQPRSGKERSPKQAIVAKILCRWWYVMPPWPPEDFDFDATLRSAGFRRVPVEAFDFELDVDDHGLKKVFAVSGGYVGLYRTEQGRLVDARPVEGKPSYDQLMVKSTPELHKMLLTAFSNQLKELESQPNSGRDFEAHRQELLREIKEARRATSFSKFFKVGGASSGA
jgi:hypothetical protein